MHGNVGDRSDEVGMVRPSLGLFITLLPLHAGQALTTALLGPIAPSIAGHFGGGSTGALAGQFAVVIPFLGVMIGGLISGWGIDVAGLRRFSLLGTGLYAVAGIVGLVAPGVAILLLGCTLLGFGAAFQVSGLSAVTAIAYQGTERARAVGFQSAATHVVTVSFGLASAFLAQWLGWRTPFGFFFAFGAVLLLLSAIYIPASARKSVRASASFGWVLGRTWAICIAGGVAFLLLASIATQVPFLLEQQGITTTGIRSVVMTCTTAASVVASLIYGQTQARTPERRYVIIGAISAAIGWCVFGFWSGDLITVFVAAALVGFGMGFAVPLLFNAAMRAAPGEASGLSTGLLNATICVGGLFNPLVFAPIRNAFGLSNLMVVLAGLTICVALVATLSARRTIAE